MRGCVGGKEQKARMQQGFSLLLLLLLLILLLECYPALHYYSWHALFTWPFMKNHPLVLEKASSQPFITLNSSTALIQVPGTRLWSLRFTPLLYYTHLLDIPRKQSCWWQTYIHNHTCMPHHTLLLLLLYRELGLNHNPLSIPLPLTSHFGFASAQTTHCIRPCQLSWMSLCCCFHGTWNTISCNMRIKQPVNSMIHIAMNMFIKA